MVERRTAPTGAIARSRRAEDEGSSTRRGPDVGHNARPGVRFQGRFATFAAALGIGILVAAPLALPTSAAAAILPIETIAKAEDLCEAKLVMAAIDLDAALDKAGIARWGRTDSDVAAKAEQSGAVSPVGRADRIIDEERLAGRDPFELLRFGAMRIPRWLVVTVLRASEVTGADRTYMMALADKESSFLVANRASTSSAEGLFQFVERTWFEVIRDFGPKHHLKAEAAAVATVNGVLTIADDETRERVLHLRRDPYVAALMAGEMKNRDRQRIERQIGRDLTRSELYLAHFMGASGASRLLSLLDEKPKESAPKAFPAAAKANKNIFFAKDGKKTRDLTVSEVKGKLDQMIDARLARYVGVANIPTAAESQH
jgi:hypothetical protein